MAHNAVERDVDTYDRTSFMIRSRLYKGLTNGTMQIRSFFDDERYKLENGKLYSDSVVLDGSCTLKARTFNGDKSSFTYSYPLTFLGASKVKVKNNGLNYKFYSDPAIRSITSVEHLTPERYRSSGVTAVPSLQKHEEEDWYGYKFEGWIKVPASGIYRFKLDTDDGSQLRIDDVLLVNNNYNKGNMISTGYAYLEKGLHKFDMSYFEGHFGEKISVEWQIPGTSSFVSIPAEVFFQEK